MSVASCSGWTSVLGLETRSWDVGRGSPLSKQSIDDGSRFSYPFPIFQAPGDGVVLKTKTKSGRHVSEKVMPDEGAPKK